MLFTQKSHICLAHRLGPSTSTNFPACIQVSAAEWDAVAVGSGEVRSGIPSSMQVALLWKCLYAPCQDLSENSSLMQINPFVLHGFLHALETSKSAVRPLPRVLATKARFNHSSDTIDRRSDELKWQSWAGKMLPVHVTVKERQCMLHGLQVKETGWGPHHLLVREEGSEGLLGCCPLYLKVPPPQKMSPRQPDWLVAQESAISGVEIIGAVISY